MTGTLGDRKERIACHELTNNYRIYYIASRRLAAIFPQTGELLRLPETIEPACPVYTLHIKPASKGNGIALRLYNDSDSEVTTSIGSGLLRIISAQTCDLVLLNAGSSAGSEDFSSRVVEKLGQLLVHGVAVRPGHPVILGTINRGPLTADDVPTVHRPSSIVPIIGVPGYPVSAALTVDIFVEPLIAKWLGRHPLSPDRFCWRRLAPAGVAFQRLPKNGLAYPGGGLVPRKRRQRLPGLG